MKKILLSLFTLAVMGFTAKVKAQCDLQFNNLVVQIEAPGPTSLGPNKCRGTFTASFDITTNSGFKYLFFHSWLAADYPNPSIFDCTGSSPAADPGTHIQLGTVVDEMGKSFLDIGFIGLKAFLTSVPLNTPTNITSLFAATYPHDNTVVLISPSSPNNASITATVTKEAGNILHFVIQHITVDINQPCANPLSVKTDIWGSNSNANDPKAQCYVCANAALFNDPAITGFKTCDRPDRKYAMGVTTTTVTPDLLTWRVYIDTNNNGALEDAGNDGITQVGDDIMVATGTYPNFSSANPYSSGAPVTYPPYSHDPLYADKPLIFYAKVSLGTNAVTKFIPNAQGCIPLPVSFKSFTAV